MVTRRLCTHGDLDINIYIYLVRRGAFIYKKFIVFTPQLKNKTPEQKLNLVKLGA